MCEIWREGLSLRGRWSVVRVIYPLSWFHGALRVRGSAQLASQRSAGPASFSVSKLPRPS
jgi:hypothetical protein